jgi:FkbM family methyltransferase
VISWAHFRHTARRIAPRGLKRHHYEMLLRNNAPEDDALACIPYIREGEVLDVGANIGCYTRVLSERVGPRGRVHALEPFPETFDYLCHNIRVLRLPNVSCYNVAASSHDGYGQMALSWDESLGWARLVDKGGTAVRLAALDSLFPDLNPTFIKCDVEGHELQVIAGALGMIARCRPVWLIEVSCPETQNAMNKLGYVSTRLTENYLFVPEAPGRQSAAFAA